MMESMLRLANLDWIVPDSSKISRRHTQSHYSCTPKPRWIAFIGR
ncbi:hypothetical protein HZU75_11885 [Chitinibacter fontanus]|uniref:Uncharacterized protein n=1 Tax=Chitinibacter fontanus TaxID=1737446 RepID=A0A7D5ZKW9_9NEIS|nr:hypothetical protein HZU75_11885 [Chitinibacter fontanus]